MESDTMRHFLKKLLSDEVQLAGEHRLVWDGVSDAGTPAPSGVYVVRLTASDGQARFERTRRMALVK
jgi:flagellar hook assembly protein FlgD